MAREGRYLDQGDPAGKWQSWASSPTVTGPTGAQALRGFWDTNPKSISSHPWKLSAGQLGFSLCVSGPLRENELPVSTALCSPEKSLGDTWRAGS